MYIHIYNKGTIFVQSICKSSARRSAYSKHGLCNIWVLGRVCGVIRIIRVSSEDQKR